MKIKGNRRWIRKERGTAIVRIAGLLLAMMLVAVSIVLPGCGDAMAQARALEDQGDLSGAVALYREVLEQEPDNAEALLGAALDLSFLGRFDEALVFQERLVAIDPGNVQIRTELGFNYLNHQDRSADAVRVLTEAAALDRSAKQLTFLSQAQIAAGDHEAAERSLTEAIEIDPQYGHSYSVLVRMLEDDMRSADAAEVRESAASRGIDITIP